MERLDLSALKNVVAVVEIGAIVSVFLFGIFVIQLYVYYSRFPDDPLEHKALVACVSSLELGHVISALHCFYTLSIEWYGDPDKLLGKSPLGISVQTLLGGYIACLVQIFFTHRARRLTGAKYLTALCYILSLARFVFTTLIVVYLIKETFPVFVQKRGWLMAVCLAVGAAVDIIIAILLCWHLVRERKTAFQRTTRMIDRIILMTVQTGLMTSLLTLFVMILFEVMTDHYVWVALYMCLARVFSNSLLATLNARTVFQRMTEMSLRFVDVETSPIKFDTPKIQGAIPHDISGAITTRQSSLDPR